jgi:hypothetical protein
MSNNLDLSSSPLTGTRGAAAGGDPAVTVRPASPGDAPALAGLAALDSGAPPSGPALVAEVGGELWAALPLEGGRAIADPFRATADVVALLHLRASHLRGAAPAPARRRLGLLPRTARA